MRRGEIWWAELTPPAGRHPVLLLSRDEAYAVRELVNVVPVTTRMRHISSEVSWGQRKPSQTMRGQSGYHYYYC